MSLLNEDIEHRTDRAYDEADPSHLVHPNGSLVASYDRGFLASATREVIAQHLQPLRTVVVSAPDGETVLIGLGHLSDEDAWQLLAGYAARCTVDDATWLVGFNADLFPHRLAFDPPGKRKKRGIR